MKKIKKMMSLLIILCCISSYAQSGKTSLTLHLDQEGVRVSPILYGLMTEEINYSYEGGLYAQLVRNPSFKDIARYDKSAKVSMPSFWSLKDTLDGDIRVDFHGINAANNTSLEFTVKNHASVTNDGYWGYPMCPNTTYQGGIYLKTDNWLNGHVTVSLISADGSIVYATTTINSLSKEWRKYAFSLTTPNNLKPTKNAKLMITAEGTGKYWLTRVTLFPPTYKNRTNGLRQDLMKMMKEMNPKFLRFPGGNYLEGDHFAERFNWKATIGNPDERMGHQSPWKYSSTDGMGLLEFLEWAEDIGAEPLLAVFAGYTLNGDHVEGEYLQPFIQDALDEIEYITGGPETRWGAQRIKDGHPEPFKLRFIEIGNEDWFDRSGSYTQRYKQLYDAIKAKYPEMNLISTIGGNTRMGNTMNVPGLKVDIIDEHYYRNAANMFINAHQYDGYKRDGAKIFVGEWATREGAPTTNMNAALGDAVWMTGMERNSDIVIASCYAPLFVNVNKGGMQWSSNLIGYDVLNAYGSPSYYAQKMFSNHLGDRLVPIDTFSIARYVLPMNHRDSAEGKKPTYVDAIYYVATKETKNGNVFLKIVNISNEQQNIRININGAKKILSKAQKIELKSDHSNDTNDILHPTKIIPKTSAIKMARSTDITLPSYSITVLNIGTK